MERNRFFYILLRKPNRCLDMTCCPFWPIKFIVLWSSSSQITRWGAMGSWPTWLIICVHEYVMTASRIDFAALIQTALRQIKETVTWRASGVGHTKLSQSRLWKQTHIQMINDIDMILGFATFMNMWQSQGCPYLSPDNSYSQSAKCNWNLTPMEVRNVQQFIHFGSLKWVDSM